MTVQTDPLREQIFASIQQFDRWHRAGILDASHPVIRARMEDFLRAVQEARDRGLSIGGAAAGWYRFVEACLAQEATR